MTMKIITLRTYWDAGGAQMAIDVLDELRDRLWDAYGDDIAEMHRSMAHSNNHEELQQDAWFDDEIDF